MNEFLGCRSQMRDDFQRKNSESMTQQQRRRYNLMILSYIFMKKRREVHAQVLPTGIVNGKRDVYTSLAQKLGFDLRVKHLISYPIFAIHEYLSQNIESLAGDNMQQIAVAKKFGIKNLETLYQIVAQLGLVKELGWILIKLPLEKFEGLRGCIEDRDFIATYGPKSQRDANHGTNGEVYFEIAQRIGVDNFAHIFTGISALGAGKKLGVKRLRFTAQNARKILSYVQEHFSSHPVITIRELDILCEVFGEELLSNPEDARRSLSGLLSVFGYKISINAGDISQYKSRGVVRGGITLQAE